MADHATGQRLPVHSHRCDDCSAPWVSTRATETACLFCGSSNVHRVGDGTRTVATPAPKATKARSGPRKVSPRGPRTKPRGSGSSGQANWRDSVDRRLRGA